MTVGRLTNALIKSIKTSADPFMTYGEFGRAFGFSDKYPPAWANKNTLDAVATALENDPQLGIDLTFVIRNGTTGFPSVIDGKPYKRNDLAQEKRARDVANEIIEKFGLTAKNPYLNAKRKR